MIFSECENGHVITSGYEAGDEHPGALELVTCEECGAKSYIERVSFGGRTLNQREFEVLKLRKIEPKGEKRLRP